MSAETVISAASAFALFMMCAAFFLTVCRVISGPTLPDRIVALDMLVAIAIGFIAVVAIRTGFTLYIDVAITLGLVGFLATVAFARFLMTQAMQPGEEGPPDAPPGRRRRAGAARAGRKGR